MKNKMLGFTLFALMSLQMSTESAAHGLDMDAITVGGPGCAGENVGRSIEVLPGGALKVVLQFSEYNVLVGYGKTLDRSSCALSLPISLNPGERLKVSRLTLRADGILAQGSKTLLKAEIFTAGQQGRVGERVILPDQEIQGRFTLRGRDILETECGEDSNLRVNTSILINSQGTGLESGLRAASLTLILGGESCN